MEHKDLGYRGVLQCEGNFPGSPDESLPLLTDQGE